MTKRIAYARMVMNGALSYHGGRHLIELAELGRQRACEAVGVEVLRWRGQGVAIVSQIIQPSQIIRTTTKREWL